MNLDRDESCLSWSIFQIVAPGHTFPRWVIAASIKRALALAVRDDDTLEANEHLIAWNVTGAFMTMTSLMAHHTWATLREAREGLLEYDGTIGWIRIQEGG